MMIIAILVSIILVVVLLTGCTPEQAAQAETQLLARLIRHFLIFLIS